jgi:hypothetical protein
MRSADAHYVEKVEGRRRQLPPLSEADVPGRQNRRVQGEVEFNGERRLHGRKFWLPSRLDKACARRRCEDTQTEETHTHDESALAALWVHRRCRCEAPELLGKDAQDWRAARGPETEDAVGGIGARLSPWCSEQSSSGCGEEKRHGALMVSWVNKFSPHGGQCGNRSGFVLASWGHRASEKPYLQKRPCPRAVANCRCIAGLTAFPSGRTMPLLASDAAAPPVSHP